MCSSSCKKALTEDDIRGKVERMCSLRPELSLVSVGVQLQLLVLVHETESVPEAVRDKMIRLLPEKVFTRTALVDLHYEASFLGRRKPQLAGLAGQIQLQPEQV